jgi:DNA-binding PucR family transcriptional regulator
MTDYHAKSLRELRAQISHNPVAVAAIERLARGAAVLATQLQQAVLAEVPQFANSRNPDLLPDLVRHSKENLDEVIRLLRGGALGNLEFVQAQARSCAAKRFPLESMLHAYRTSFRVLSRWLRESVLAMATREGDAQQAVAAVAEFAMEYADAISTTFASVYASHSLLLAEVAGDQRSELLRVLLKGHDETDIRAARLLREAGFLDERQFFCVALAQSVDPTEMLNASRARRMADSIEQIVAQLGVRRLVDLHNNKVTMVFAAVSRDSGWTAPRRSLAQQIRTALSLVGNAALIGVSNDVPSTAHIPTAYREAATALELASVSQRVVQFSEIPLQRLVLHFAAQDFSRVLPAWAGAFYEADAKANGALIGTLRAYASVDMNILKSADLLAVHPNTVYARLQRIFDISGLQARSFNALSDLLIVCDFVHRGAGGPFEPLDQ